jgi:hypothetical protein
MDAIADENASVLQQAIKSAEKAREQDLIVAG